MKINQFGIVTDAKQEKPIEKKTAEKKPAEKKPAEKKEKK